MLARTRDAGRGVLWWIGTRFLLGRKSRLLGTTARSALGLTSLGVAAMVIAMALMSGYTGTVQSRLLHAGPLIVSPLGDGATDVELADAMAAELRELPGVGEVGVTVVAQGSLSSRANRAGVDVHLRGVVPGLSTFGAEAGELARGDDGVAAIVLGRQLEASLGVATGDLLRLVAITETASGEPRFAYRTLRVQATFETGLSEYDRSYAVVDRDTVVAVGGGRVVLEVAASPGANVTAVAARLEEQVGAAALVTDWRRSNRKIFEALRTQKWTLFLVVGLVVLVSSFNIASALVVMVRERSRDTAVLTALGLGPRRLRRLFLGCGLCLGFLGTAFGLTVGSAVSVIITRYELVRFGPGVTELYFINSVPFDLRTLDLFAVACFSLLLTALACWWPARLAGATDPARALHWE